MKNKSDESLPGILKAYNDEDFGLKAKVNFFYHVIIAMAIGMSIVILYTAYIQLISPDLGYLFLPVLVPEIFILFIILLCLYLLIQGRFNFSIHMLLIASMSTIWIIMFFDKANILSRFDTILYVFSIMSMIPLTIKHGKIAVLIYVGSNFLVLIVFLMIQKTQLNLPFSTLIEFFMDVFITLSFIGIVGYKIFIINKRAYEKTIYDLNERHQTEKALLESEKKFNETIELLPQTIFETDINGILTYVNKYGFKSFGYDPEDIKPGLSVLNMIVESDRIVAKENIEKMFKKEHTDTRVYTALRKDGTTFPVEIYPGAISENGKFIGFRGIIIDISERKKTERELVESRQQFQILAQMSPVGIFRTNANGSTTYVNPKWMELSGSGFEDAAGDGWLKAVHPDDREMVIKNWKGDYNSKSNSIAEYRFQRPDGEILWVLGNAVPEIINGELNGFIGTITNITEIKNSQELLEKSEKRFRDLAEMLPGTIWESTLEGKLTFVNKHGLILFGFSEDDVNSGLDIFGRLIPEDREKAYINIQEVLSGTRTRYRGDEYLAERKDGSKFPIKVFVSMIVENQVPVGMRGIIIDMSEIRDAENKLRESEARYRSIIEAFPDIIMISDLKGNIIYGNQPLERITGITEADFRNLKRKARIHPDDIKLVSAAIKDLLDGDKKHTGIIENRFIDNNNKLHWFSGIISKIIVDGQPMLQTISRDITLKKADEIELENYRSRLELLVNERTDELNAINEELVSINDTLIEQHEELESTLENLKQAQKQLVLSEKMASLGILAAGVAHEINNPLNFIQGGILGLEIYFKENIENHLSEVKPLIEGINEGVRRAADIVASLSHYSRHNDMPTAQCDIHEIIDNCLVMLQNQTKNRIKITKDFFKFDYELKCNEGKIHQAILNLLLNAVQSIKNDGEIIIKTSLVGDNLKISISDTGCGISDENLGKIFDPFFSTKETGKGTGLGLSITYNIIHEHQGAIHCQSKINSGTEFIITLPAKLMIDGKN